MLVVGKVLTNSPRAAGVIFVASEIEGEITLKFGASASIFESKDLVLLPALKYKDGFSSWYARAASKAVRAVIIVGRVSAREASRAFTAAASFASSAPGR